MAWLIKGLGPGGAERLLAEAARRRDRRRVSAEVVYLLPRKDALVEEIRATGVTVTCLSGRTSDLRWALRLRRHLVSGDFDVVHAHSPVLAIAARLMLQTLPRRRRPKMVTTDHNVWHSHALPVRLLDALTCALDDAHLAVSRAVATTEPARLRRRTEVVVHGVDGESLRAQADRAAVRRELDLDGTLVVGTVANLRATKGYPDLLVAARRVLDTVPGVRFVAVGQGPQTEMLRDLHARLELGDGFRFLGYRRDAPRVLSGCDVFCMASLHEGLPVALMEAIALGLPVVATDVGGVGEVVRAGEDAVLVPPAKPMALADALIGVLADASRRSRMAAAAAARGATLSVDAAIRRTEAVYREVLAR